MKLRTENPWLKISIITFILCLLIVIDITHLFKTLHALEQKNAALTNEINALQTSLAKSNIASNEALRLTNSYREALQKLSNIADISLVLKILADAAKFSNAEFDNFKPQNEKNYDFFTIKPFSIEIYGSYFELNNFLYSLTVSKIPMTLTRLNMQPVIDDNSSENKILLKADFDFYILRCCFSSKPQLENPVNFASKTFAANLKDPFASFYTQGKNESLAMWHVQELQMLGTIFSSDKIWAIVGTPLGNSYHVTIGDRIGKNNSVITKITANQIITDNSNEYLFANKPSLKT
jgi:Tfp pilus assembly protein PilO